ncbi:5750_t:CDS:2 [Ambispora gerdemannii]|uniref:5750_t:CDS:1 n=1 Tax=Ambispora gerdemannii TaxID=144530 RepID=A0A9N9FUZ8_9GLOM|nr:5750_t:CDS:2 [Ambispora gerdemannii]
MKAIKGGLDNISSDFRRNLNAVNPHLGNPHLSKLLTAEKTIWNSLSTWSYEHNETSKYLAAWGKSEGIDLNDVTEKLSYLFAKMAEAEGALADKYTQYRTHLKDIRAQESTIKDQRFKKESYWSKIEKEERRASTSKHPEASQAIIAKYHEEIEKLEKESIVEETALGDFKREKLREALLVQMEALHDFSTKMLILSNFSKEIIEQIPLEKIEPGEQRTYHDTKTHSHGLAVPSIGNNNDDDEIEGSIQDFKDISEQSSPILEGDSSNEADQSDLDQTDVTDVEGEKRLEFTAFSPKHPNVPAETDRNLSAIQQIHYNAPQIESVSSVNLVPQTAEIRDVLSSESITTPRLDTTIENIINSPDNNANETNAMSKTTVNVAIIPPDSTPTDNNTIQQTSSSSNSITLTNQLEDENHRDRIAPPQKITNNEMKHVQLNDIENELP